MLMLKRSLVAVGFLWLALTCQVLPAGYPPFGAWAYGSGWSYSSPVGHWHGRYYATSGYSSVRYRSFYRPFAYARYRAWYPSVHVYTPVVSYPAYYPVYSVPVVWPTYYSVPIYPSYCEAGIPSSVSNASFPVSLAAAIEPQQADAQQAQFVAIDYSASALQANTIPASLLSSADAIFRAGGYREAAKAYAQLNVRYGSSNQIFGRRFVAQVACGDLDQAAVILESAKIAGFEFHQSELPGTNLADIFGGDTRKISMLTEQLAAKAMAAPTEREPLEMVGQWLRLVGDDTRASLFLTMAQHMEDGTEQEGVPTPLPKMELVSLE